MKIISFFAKEGLARVAVSDRRSLGALVSLLNGRGVDFKVASDAGLLTQEECGFGGVGSWKKPDDNYETRL